MCNCINNFKANEISKLTAKVDVHGDVSSSWSDSMRVRVTNKLQRVRVVERPVVSITLKYSKTTTQGNAFKKKDVIVIKIKPVFCSLCGGKL